MKFTLKTIITTTFIFTGTALAATLHSEAHFGKPPESFSIIDNLSTVVTDSFSHRDQSGSLAIDEYNQSVQGDKRLEEYKGLNQFDSSKKIGDDFFPWRKGPFLINGKVVSRLNLDNYNHAQHFSDLVFQYILEGWFTQKDGSQIAHGDDHFRDNSYRTWCTTPGVVDGSGGREAVHGLTKELGLKPNPLFPAGHGVDSYSEDLWQSENKSKRPAGWGQPFFNATVCEKYQKIFGNSEKARLPLMDDQDLLKNKAGFVSFKLHFNAMEHWRSYKPFNGAYKWSAHVSSSRGENVRSLKKIPLIQISVSMKLDPSYIDGLKNEDGTTKADDWVMLAFYHDADFLSSKKIADHVPIELRHMRPMGIQTGFGPKDTIMFKGSKSNYKVNEVNPQGEIVGVIWHENDNQTLLNGPADNAYSSCMGCHAGFNYMNVLEARDPMRGGADGLSFYDVTTFNRVRQQYGKGVDFNLQLYNAFGRIEAWREKVDSAL